jgi:hypothetical protein
MSALGLLVVGGSGDDLREHGSHDARRGRTAGTREKFLLADRWIRDGSFVYPTCDTLAGPEGAQFVDLGIYASWRTNLRTKKC